MLDDLTILFQLAVGTQFMVRSLCWQDRFAITHPFGALCAGSIPPVCIRVRCGCKPFLWWDIAGSETWGSCGLWSGITCVDPPKPIIYLLNSTVGLSFFAADFVDHLFVEARNQCMLLSNLVNHTRHGHSGSVVLGLTIYMCLLLCSGKQGRTQPTTPGHWKFSLYCSPCPIDVQLRKGVSPQNSN